MPDFSKLANAKAGEAKKPKALPEGNYSGIVKGWSFEPAQPGKNYESVVRFNLGLIDWPSTVSDDEKTQDLGAGPKPIDLSKMQMRRDFYDNVLYRLDDFIKSCGVDMNDRTYNEVLPELVGKRVVVQVKQYLNERTSEIGNNVGDLVGEQ